jgi:hypothetical protein
MEKRAISFAKDIRPLFRQIDLEHMSRMNVLLDDYTFMSDPGHAQAVYEYLDGTRQPQMPPGGPYWSEEQLNVYSEWIAGGRKP